jgi:co-chaperonin GroES (HSP10)
MNIKAHGTHVIIERDAKITQRGSILLATEQVSDRGTVVSVGHKVLSDIKPGDHVIFKKWQDRTVDSETLTIVQEADIWLVDPAGRGDDDLPVYGSFEDRFQPGELEALEAEEAK